MSTWVASTRNAEGAVVPWGGGSPPLATNGVVSGFARMGNTLYLLGAFTSIGPNTGGGVPVDPASGRPVQCYARVAGTVLACVPDGRGGWFLGGDFSGVGGVARANVAHVREDGTVSPWRGDTDGAVRALALDGETLYIGGDFVHVANQERDHLAAVCARSGVPNAWNPAVSGTLWYYPTTVNCILSTTGVVYIGGAFTSVQGENRSCLAALDKDSARVLALSPSPDGPVHALACADSCLYLGGAFYSVGGQSCHGLARVSTLTGDLRPWNGSIASPGYDYDLEPYVSALAICDTSLYVAGHFTRVGGEVRGGIAAVDLVTGQPQAWDPNPIDEGSLREAPYIFCVAIGGTNAYVGGRFSGFGSASRWHVVAVSRATGAVGDFDPRPDGEVDAVGVGERSVFVGGEFASVGGWEVRNQLAAVDLETGALKPWSPDPGWGQVMCLAAGEHAVYVGGRFSSINGVARQNIVALDPESGAPTSWNPGVADGFFTAVYTIAVGGERVYAGGDFATVGGLPRRYLAAIDTAGRVGPWDPEPNSQVRSLCPAGASIYVAGAFRQIGGELRMGLAEVDTALGAATPWNPGTDGWVLSLAVAGDAIYAGGQFQEIAGVARASLGAIDRATGLATDWDPGAVNSSYASVPIIRALVPVDDVLYVAGDFSQIGGAPRSFAAALDTASATALDWDPGVSPGPLWGLLVDGHTVYFGGRVDRYGVTSAGGYGVVPAVRRPRAVGNQVAVGSCYPNPATGSATLSFVLPAPAQVSLTVFDVQGRRVCQPIANELRSAGVQSAGIRVGDWPPGCYLCRLDIGGRAFTRKLVVLGG